MDIQVGNLANLQWLWLLAIVSVVVAVAAVLRRRALARFATANLIGQLIPAGGRMRRVAKAVLVLASLAAMVLALIDVRWGKTWRDVPQKGVEVMFVLDVSRSMLAQDAPPNRLDRAKQQITDMVDAMTGDRVGLVVFAGDARRRIPLTSHHNDFKQTLAEVGPQDVARGGSRLGDAIRVAADSFLNKTTDHKAIVLFTDGEDMESDPIKQAQKVHQERGVRIFTVGLGDATQGERIPVSTSRGDRSYLQYNGQQVWSKMNGQVLRQIATDTGGAYIPAGTKQVDMAGVYRNYIAGVEQQEFETARVNSYIPRFQWFVGAALLLLMLDTVIGYGQRVVAGLPRAVAGLPTEPRPTTEGLPRREKRSTPKKLPPAPATIASLAFITACCFTASASAADISATVRRGNEALAAGKFDEALTSYQQAATEEPARVELLYNQAVAHYRKGEYEQARGLFTQATAAEDRGLEAKARFNLAGCDYAEAVALAEKDKPAAIERLQRAISHYRGALQSNPDEGDARANIELAQMLIKKLQDEEKQDQQKQDDQKQDDQKQDDRQKQDQENQDQQKQDDKQQRDQQQDQQKQDQEKSDEQKQDQQQSGEQKEDEQQDQQKQEQPDQDQQKSGEQKQDQQKQDQQKQDQQKQEEQKSSDEKDQQQDQQQAGQPQAADQDQQPQGAPQYGGESTAEQEAQPMTKEEAQKMLQAVRDRDLMRRLEQLEQRRSRHIPVDKDW